jgi:hypothetical protein
MTKKNRSPLRRTLLVLGALGLFAPQLTACFVDIDPITVPENPRLGKNKKVVFASGCSSSLVMAVGATDTITVSSANENTTLPADLTAKSSDPAVISLTETGKDPLTFDMKALKKGQSDIEVDSAGALFDSITFSAEPAKKVNFQSETAVIAGGRLGLGVTEIFGACGDESCALFGHTFMVWSAEPAPSFTFLKDESNLAYFTAGAMAGTGAVVGKEPSEGGELVRQSIEIVDPATITGVQGSAKVQKGEEREQVAVPCPAKVPQGATFYVKLEGVRAGKTPVAISRHDIVWTVPPELTLVTQIEPADPIVDTFIAPSGVTGDFTLTAKIAILGGKEQAFVVTITPP